MKSKALSLNVQQTIVKVTDTLSAATEKILIAYEKMDDKGDSINKELHVLYNQ